MAEGNNTLVLNYGSMCDGKGGCNCGGKPGHCMLYKKKNYQTSQCQKACTAWFPGDVTLAGACKSACEIDCGDDRDAKCKPQSQADYLKRFTTDLQLISKYGYDFDPSTGVGSGQLAQQKAENLMSRVFNVVLVIVVVVVIYFLANKYLGTKA